MPKGGTITFPVEPRAVLGAADWLLRRDPYAPETMSIVLASLDPKTRKARAVEHWQKVSDATLLMLGWLHRRNRIASPDVKTNITLPREMVQWLGGFDAPRLRGGIFGSSAARTPRAGSMTAPAELFFFRCRVAGNRKMGRPRLTPDQAARRLQHDTELAESTVWRLTARSAQTDIARLSGLLATLKACKTPNFSE
jgi:hypothetical protein